MSIKRKAIIFILLSIFLLVIFVCSVNYSVRKNSVGKIFKNNTASSHSSALRHSRVTGGVTGEKLEQYQVALVLGARVYSDGRLSDMFSDRAKTALELYKTGKVKKILISGDHGRVNYDEVGAAKDFFLENKIPAEDLFLDHAGFDTYDSIYRARDIFQVESMIIVTQEFHLPRALYIADKLGIESIGAIADKQSYINIDRNYRRERLANIKAFLNIIFNANPKFLGQKIPISGDSSLSWD